MLKLLTSLTHEQVLKSVEGPPHRRERRLFTLRQDVFHFADTLKMNCFLLSSQHSFRRVRQSVASVKRR